MQHLDDSVSKRFSHLHVHSDASRLDGLGPVNSLVQYAANMGFAALAITDHGSLTNTLSFIAECRTAGIKPIVGLEAYLSIDEHVHHLTLLGDGMEGFNSLVALNNLGMRSKFMKPAFDVDQLIKHNRGIYLMTGCIASPFQAMPLQEAVHLGKRLLPHFQGRMFAETMAVSSHKSWARSMELSAQLGIPPIVTNDVHFSSPNLSDIHHLLTNMKAGFEYESSLLYLATPSDILARITGESSDVIKFFSRGLDNAGRLAARITSPAFTNVSTLPHIPNGMKQLWEMCEQAITDREVSPTVKATWRTRLKYELEIIEQMGYESYFVILADIVQYARRNGVRVGPGRGSAAGSLALYLLGVTEIDPIEFDLSFERFLNPSRKGMPDVDVDFDSESRDCVIDYASERWGGVGVATYTRYTHKVLIHDLAKQFRVERRIEELVADSGPDSKEFAELRQRFPDLAKAYDAIIGQIKSIGQHAGGIVITDIQIPLEKTAGGDRRVAAWTEGDDRQLSSVGVVKYDLLGITALTVLKRLEAMFGHRAPDPVDNAPEFELFRTGNLDGIFQFSGSSGIISYTQEVAPTSFNDLVAINALYRPGALDAGTAKLYPSWRKTPRRLHPQIDPIIEDTYGAIVYQEQVMSIVSVVTGGTLADADNARRVIIKSKVGDPEWEQSMADLLTDFMAKGVSRGFDPGLLNLLWGELKTHARYSFNRAHAVAYARIAWDLAWWKFHHPAQFYAETINSDTTDARHLIYAAARSGLEIKPPHVNFSGVRWEAVGNTLYAPLTVVKFLGVDAAKMIVDNRPYASIEDFNARLPKKVVRSNAKENLAVVDAFAGIPGDVSTLIKKVWATREEAQLAALGFPIPSKSILDTIESITAGGWIAGIVTEAQKRTSQHYGDYWVYRLSPNGNFWIRSSTQTYNPGHLVAARVSSSSGKAISHKRL